jgi:hypothetical protein
MDKQLMVNALARLGDRILRGVLPAAERQACVYELDDRTNIHSLSKSEWYGSCTNSCHQRKCTIELLRNHLGLQLLGLLTHLTSTVPALADRHLPVCYVRGV